MMEATGRTLVILLSMHRSGSSLTASILQRLGMSLGPWELVGASPSNPYGHFESIPICEVNRKVQDLLHGFMDDMPTSEENLKSFLARERSRDAVEAIPEELLEQGRLLIAGLLDSGPVSGFKDPRTILTWPFWRRVLREFPDVRVVPIALVRSPHPIAMSLCTRSEGTYGYWACLDLVAVHLRRLRAIIQEWETSLPTIRFGTGQYLNDLAESARLCGLSWDPTAARGNIDDACIHHAPATVAHESQSLYQALAGLSVEPVESSANRARLAEDERVRESLGSRRIAQLVARLDEAEHRLRQAEARLEEISHEATQTRDRWREAEERLARSHAEAQAQARTHAEVQELLDRSRTEVHALHARLEHFEAHFVLGPAIRGRRRLKMMIDHLKSRAAI